MFLQKVFDLINQSISSNNNKAGFPALNILSSLREVCLFPALRKPSTRDLFPPWFGFLYGEEGEFSLPPFTQWTSSCFCSLGAASSGKLATSSLKK